MLARPASSYTFCRASPHDCTETFETKVVASDDHGYVHLEHLVTVIHSDRYVRC